MPQLHEQHTCTVVLLYMESWWCRARTLALKIQVKYEWAWSHHGWVIVTCQASPESNYGQPLWKSYGWDDKQKSPVCTHRQKDLSCINMLKTMQSMSELGSLQKHKSIKNVRIFCWIWLLYGQRNDCTHVHAHTHMQTPHTHTNTHERAHTYVHERAQTHTHTQARAHTCIISHVTLYNHKPWGQAQLTDIFLCQAASLWRNVHSHTMQLPTQYAYMYPNFIKLKRTPTHTHTHTPLVNSQQ